MVSNHLRRRPDVLIGAEQILRIVLGFDLRQPRLGCRHGLRRSLQLGTQMHWPLELHVDCAPQVPQVPPQPSGPHDLPPHWGTHAGVFAMPGLDPIAPTGRKVQIPEHYFFYRVAGERIVMIRPEVVAGGAPRGILEQIGVPLPPL